MVAVIQRVKEASVRIDGQIAGNINSGLLVLLGVAKADRESDAAYLSEKVLNLRIFQDENNKMNRSLRETGGQMLVVSQFTLLADSRKGRRPSFVHAAQPDTARRLYEYFIDQTRQQGVDVQTGQFGAMMDVFLVNDGPVTLIVESKSMSLT
ncbi:MAG: D-aminoacyl-tRNA deacylase [Desulfobacterales bacterium]|nr:D-aminoacyl-tRNA deacylase [Desulfobacterales bacterium]